MPRPPARAWRHGAVTEPPRGFPGAEDALETALASTGWDGLALGGPRPAERLADEPEPRALPMPRLTLVQGGTLRLVLSRGGRRQPADLGPGQAVFHASQAWEIERWDRPVRFIGVVFHQAFIRILHLDHAGGPAPAHASRTAHHTALPPDGAMRHLLAALDLLADDGGDAARRAAGSLCQGLVRLVLAALRRDLAGARQDDPGLEAWRTAMAYLEERLAGPVTRGEAAQAAGVHPHYLSALCTRHGGRSFQATLEDLRLARARELLAREPDLSAAAVGGRCGFPDPGHFTRVFRRRLGVPPARWRRGGADGQRFWKGIDSA